MFGTCSQGHLGVFFGAPGETRGQNRADPTSKTQLKYHLAESMSIWAETGPSHIKTRSRPKSARNRAKLGRPGRRPIISERLFNNMSRHPAAIFPQSRGAVARPARARAQRTRALLAGSVGDVSGGQIWARVPQHSDVVHWPSSRSAHVESGANTAPNFGSLGPTSIETGAVVLYRFRGPHMCVYACVTPIPFGSNTCLLGSSVRLEVVDIGRRFPANSVRANASGTHGVRGIFVLRHRNSGKYSVTRHRQFRRV